MKEVVFPNVASGSPDSPEWHAWRARGLGGSDSPVIASDAGLASRSSWMPTLHELWEMKLGIRPRPKSNPAMARGRNFEDAGRQKYELVSGRMVSPLFGEMDRHPEIRSSFDGVSFNRKLNVEVKIPGAKTHESAKNGVVPGHYLPQLAHQGLTLWGYPEDWPNDVEVDFVTYQPESGDIAIVNFGMGDPEALARMNKLKALATALLPHLLKFWKHIQTKTPPGQQMDEWTIAAHEYRVADEAEAEAKTIKERAKEELLKLTGDAEKRSGAGVTVSVYSQAGAVDYKKLIPVLVRRDAVESILETLGIDDEELRKKLLVDAGVSDDLMNAYRAKESSRTKITIDKDYEAPVQSVVFEATVMPESEEERSYSW